MQAVLAGLQGFLAPVHEEAMALDKKSHRALVSLKVKRAFSRRSADASNRSLA